MSTSRTRALLAATLLAAAALLAAAVPALADPTPTPQPPTAPTDLRVTAVTPGSVTLSWNPSTPGCCPLTGYQITYSRVFNDVVWSQSAGDVTTVTITSNIAATGQYSFSVRAVDDGGHGSASSNSITVVTPAATSGDTTPPSAPAGLQATGVTPDGVALAWNPSTDDVAVTAYQVYFFDGWYTSILVGSTAGTSIVAPLRSSSTGMSYYYVRAQDAAGNLSIASATVRVTAGTPTPTPSTGTLPPPGPCTVVYRTRTQWAGGFVADVTVTNTGTAAVDGWTLTFPFAGDQQLTASWNAAYRQAGIGVTLTALQWNRVIQPGASVTAGLIGTWTTSNASPSSAALNSRSCTMA